MTLTRYYYHYCFIIKMRCYHSYTIRKAVNRLSVCAILSSPGPAHNYQVTYFTNQR